MNKKLHIEVFGLTNDTSIINSLETEKKYSISGDFVKSLKYSDDVDKYFQYGRFNINRGLFPIILGDTLIFYGISVFDLNRVIKN